MLGKKRRRESRFRARSFSFLFCLWLEEASADEREESSDECYSSFIIKKANGRMLD